MFEDSFSFSDSIEIVPSTEESQETIKKEEVKEDLQNIGPIIVDEIKDEKDTIKNEKKYEEKEEKKDISKNNTRDSYSRGNSHRNSRNDVETPSLRQQSLYSMTADLYVEKFNEYSNIPSFIVNQLFEIDDGKGTITIEEAIIMLINLFPNTKDKINSARFIEDAIKIGKAEIINNLYRDCKLGFANIPIHSRDNLSKKITSDVENDNFKAALYDYQIMRISGYIK
jgi:hypothetical protein